MIVLFSSLVPPLVDLSKTKIIFLTFHDDFDQMNESESESGSLPACFDTESIKFGNGDG